MWGLPDLKTAEWLIILATLAGPVLAVQAQKMIERIRESRHRRVRLFYTLMGTRATRLAPDHVQALNMIDLEFYGRRIFSYHHQFPKEKKVIEAWRNYQDHLNQGAAEGWIARGDDLFTDLLHCISLALGFDFDKVHIKRGIYYPRAHDENEEKQLKIRDNLVEVLSGQQALKMAVTSLPISEKAAQRQERVQDSLIEALAKPLKIQVVGSVEADKPAIGDQK